MRALCGAIITAGALIGLGLTAVGYGLRFQGVMTYNNETKQLYGAPSLMLILVILAIAVLIGTGTAFLGLAFHHERRLREHMALHASKNEPPAHVST